MAEGKTVIPLIYRRRVGALLFLVCSLLIQLPPKSAFAFKAKAIVQDQKDAGAKSGARPLIARLFAEGYSLYRSGDFEASLSCYERGKQVSIQSSDREMTAVFLYSIGRSNLLLNRFREAQQSYLAAKDILEQLKTKDDYLIFTLGDLSRLYILTGNPVEGKKAALQCGSAIEAFSDRASWPPGYNVSYREAVIKYGRAVAAATLGAVAAAQGEPDVALDNLSRSLGLFTQLSKEDPAYQTDVAERLIDIGFVHQSAGDYLETLSSFTRALELARDFRQKDALRRALNGLGMLYSEQGEYPRALEYLKDSLAVARELRDPGRTALVTVNIGLTKLAQGEAQAALADFNDALELLKGTEAYYALIPAYEGLAAVRKSQGRGDLALASFDKALELAKRHGDKRSEAEVLWWKGETLLALARQDEALNLAEASYRLASSMDLPDISRLALTLKGKCHLKQGQYDTAAASLSHAIEIIEGLRAKVSGEEDARAFFFERRLEPYYLMSDLLAAQRKDNEALIYAERAKARALLDVLRMGKVNAGAVMTAEERTRDRDLNNQIVSLNRDIYDEKQATRPNKLRLSEFAAKLERARAEYRTFRDAIYAAHSELRDRIAEYRSTPESLTTVVHDCNTAVLDYAVLDEKVLLFVVTNDCRAGAGAKPTTVVFQTPVKRSELKALIQAFRDRLSNPHFTGQSLGSQLYKLLISPARGLLAGKSNYIVVPDDILWELPFQALRPDTNSYLIEKCALSYTPSLRVIGEMARRRGLPRKTFGTASGQLPDSSPRIDLLAFGNPALTPQTTERASLIRRDEKLAALPQAEKEVEALAELYGPERSRIYVGAAAREDNAKSDMPRARVVHFAAHGILNGANPMYSHVVLSRAANSSEDGLLEAWEVMRMDLNAEMVVLSACDSARGRVGAGEGLIGMSWAFLVAGCPTTVASQWQVDSATSTTLMIAFHRNLISASSNSYQVTKADSLRRAMITVMKNPRTRSPYFWAGFVVIGDGS